MCLNREFRSCIEHYSLTQLSPSTSNRSFTSIDVYLYDEAIYRNYILAYMKQSTNTNKYKQWKVHSLGSDVVVVNMFSPTKKFHIYKLRINRNLITKLFIRPFTYTKTTQWCQYCLSIKELCKNWILSLTQRYLLLILSTYSPPCWILPKLCLVSVSLNLSFHCSFYCNTRRN